MSKSKLLSHENKRDIVAYIKVLMPLVGLLFITFMFREFVAHAVQSGFIINMTIIGTAAYGALLIVMRLRSAQIDFRVIERFGKEAGEGANMKELLDQPWLKSVYVRHYLVHIANTGGTLNSQISQNAIENELHALEAEYSNRLELPQFISGFMIALGLLGTFIGLLETLTGISSMLDGMGAPGANVEEQFGELVTKLRAPLQGMGIAFSASMFGLITSLMLAIMMINLRRFINRVISLARNVMHDLTVISANTAPVNMPVQGRGGAADSALASSISNTTIAGRFDLLTRKIESVLDAFEASIGATQQMTNLMGFGPRMKEISERTLDELKGVNAKLSDQQRIVKNLLDVQTNTALSDNNMLELTQVSKETHVEILEAIKTLANSEIFFSQRRDQEFREKLLSEIGSLGSLQQDSKKLSQALIEVGKGNIKEVENVIFTQKEAKDEFTGMMNRLAEAVSKVEEVNIGGARHLYEIKERLNKLGNNFGVVDILASSVSGQTALMETLVEEVRALNNTVSGKTEGETNNEAVAYGYETPTETY